MRRSDLRDLKGFDLLADLDDTAREVFAQELVVREFEPGARLFDQGDPADSLLFVMDGCVKLQLANCVAVAELKAGACIGALALSGGAKRETRAEAVERTRIFELSRQGFERLVVAEPRTACRVLQAILRDQRAILFEAAEALRDDLQPVDWGD